jgi:arginine-tRNA-protein transferase
MNEMMAHYITCYQSEMPCNYYNDGRLERLELFYPDPIQMEEYHLFLKMGYRRYSNFFYHTICPNCRECVPLRIKLNQFQLTRSQKRTLRKNKDIKIEVNSQSFLDENKIALYAKYKTTKHPDNEIHQFDQEIAHFHYGFSHVLELNYFIEDKLIGVSILDDTKDGLSAVYFYYDTDYLDRRLGVFSALSEIELARETGKKYYYFGYYIEGIQRMAYKKFFRPNQILKNGIWVDFLNLKIRPGNSFSFL